MNIYKLTDCNGEWFIFAKSYADAESKWFRKTADGGDIDDSDIQSIEFICHGSQIIKDD